MHEATLVDARLLSVKFQLYFLTIITGIAIMLPAEGLAAKPLISGPPNDCNHKFWSETLRCKALEIAGLSDLPQPNADDRPTSVAGLRKYTRVFMANNKLRCVDGTRPPLYVAPAVCTTTGGCLLTDGREVDYGNPVNSDNWLITFTGGGACSASDSNGDGNYDDGERCSSLYVSEASGMSSALDAPMKNINEGIMSRDPGKNPVFAAYNSIRVEKCSYDRFNGRSTRPDVTGVLSNTSFNYTLFNHGQRIAEEAVTALSKGLHYRTWSDDGTGNIVEVSTRLPRLSDAQQVVFAGHSGGAHGLRHNVDKLAQLVNKNRPIDVRAVFDENFLPSIEAEASFAIGSNGDAYTDQWVGVSETDGTIFSYDGEDYHFNGRLGRHLQAWDTHLDESCLDAHSSASQWKCRDRQHVLFNHITTPMFIREDFTDPNREHTNNGLGYATPWVITPGCSYDDIGFDVNCTLYFRPEQEHRDRLINLAVTLLNDIGTRSEIATGVDNSLINRQPPTVHVWMPKCENHLGLYDDDSFYRTILAEDSNTRLSLHDAVVEFIDAPAIGGAVGRIHGTVGGKTMLSICPP